MTYEMSFGSDYHIVIMYLNAWKLFSFYNQYGVHMPKHSLVSFGLYAFMELRHMKWHTFLQRFMLTFTYNFLKSLWNCFLKNLNIYPRVWRAYTNFHGITILLALNIYTLVLFLILIALLMEYHHICFHMFIWWCVGVIERPLDWCCMYV